MATLDKVDLDVLFTMLKGEPGTRKSTQALSYPRPQYWISTDRKMQSIIKPARLWNIPLAEIEYDDFADYNIGQKNINQKLTQLQMNCKYKTLVLDSITSIGDVIGLQTRRSKKGSTNKAGEEKGLSVGGINVNTFDDYKAESSGFQEIISQCKDISEYHHCNIILIAHVIGERNKKDFDQTHFARIIVTGGKIISAKIPAYCQEVYHFDVQQSGDPDKEGSYRMFTVHTGDDFARTALPLEQVITFNNNPLYETYLKPAIAKLKGV